MGHFHRLDGPAHLRRLAWLAVLGPFFFYSYNLANSVAAARGETVPAIVFDWEWSVPFWAWTILPYWSSDLLYGLSFWWCQGKREIDRHGQRLVLIQCISVLFFVFFPLKLTHLSVHLDGFLGVLYDALHGFDAPYNEAPSLHVSLAVILWNRFRGWGWGAWFALIVISTMTTHQHHFIDLPTGAWAGGFVVALLPDRARPECRRIGLGLAYAAGSALLGYLSFSCRWWVLLWPAVSLSLVAAAYWTGRVEVLGKRGGWMPVWMWPYSAAAWVNTRLWGGGSSVVADGVSLGRAPLFASERAGFRSVVDLTGELPLRADRHVPMLDLVVPSREQIAEAVVAIESLAGERPTLVCCALGYSRSAAAVAAWLVTTGRAATVEEAAERVKAARPQVRILTQ